MEDNHNEYTLLFNGVTDTIKTLEKAVKKLKVLQQQAEELVISKEEAEEAEAGGEAAGVRLKGDRSG